MEVRWAIVGNGETAVFQLVGKIDEGDYIAFGLSGEPDRSSMIGGDAVLGWFDTVNGRGHVVDYYLKSKSTCNRKYGACPDVHLGTGENNVRLLSAALVNGFTILTYQRKLHAHDVFDKPITTNGSQPIIWAVGKFRNNIAAYHSHRNKDDVFLNFGRKPIWNCPLPDKSVDSRPSPESLSANQLIHTSSQPSYPVQSTTSSSIPYDVTLKPYSNKLTRWSVPPIPCYEPEDGIYYAQLGPSGGDIGYRAITGRNGTVPDYVWYINGLLLPEVYLIRNKNYTFVVQGGDKVNKAEEYHPLYITDDPEGGYRLKTKVQRQKVNVYAGVSVDSRGRSIPSAAGKLCRWKEAGNQKAGSFQSYAAYQRALFLDCEEGYSGILQFRPDHRTPNLLYYQSYSSPNLGWKINIVDECDKYEASSSEHKPMITAPLSSPDKAGPIHVSSIQEGIFKPAAASNPHHVPQVNSPHGVLPKAGYLAQAPQTQLALTVVLPHQDNQNHYPPVMSNIGPVQHYEDRAIPPDFYDRNQLLGSGNKGNALTHRKGVPIMFHPSSISPPNNTVASSRAPGIPANGGIMIPNGMAPPSHLLREFKTPEPKPSLHYLGSENQLPFRHLIASSFTNGNGMIKGPIDLRTSSTLNANNRASINSMMRQRFPPGNPNVFLGPIIIPMNSEVDRQSMNARPGERGPAYLMKPERRAPESNWRNQGRILPKRDEYIEKMKVPSSIKNVLKKLGVPNQSFEVMKIEDFDQLPIPIRRNVERRVHKKRWAGKGEDLKKLLHSKIAKGSRPMIEKPLKSHVL